jgi:putative MATE family efflux protein
MHSYITYRNIWKISYPVMMSSLAASLINATDIAFMGRVSEIALGASAIAGILYVVLAITGNGLGTGLQIMIARKAGENDTEGIGKVFVHGTVLLMLCASVLFIAMILFSEFVFSAMLKNPALMDACNEYMSYRAPGILFTYASLSLRSFYVGTGNTKPLVYSTAVLLVFNVIFNYALVFGNWGMPAMGIGGSALASTLAEGLSALYFVGHTYLKGYQLKYRFSFLQKWKRELVHELALLSWPLALQYFISLCGWFFFFIFIEHLGSHSLAISNIVRGTYMMMMTPMWGYASTTNSMVSFCLARFGKGSIVPLVRKILIVSMLTSSLVVFVCLSWAEPILGINTSDTMLVKDSMGVFRIVNAALMIFSINIIFMNALTGIGKTRMALVSELIAIVLYLIYLYLITAFTSSGIEIVWCSEFVYWIAMGLLSLYYLRKTLSRSDQGIMMVSSQI